MLALLCLVLHSVPSVFFSIAPSQVLSFVFISPALSTYSSVHTPIYTRTQAHTQSPGTSSSLRLPWPLCKPARPRRVTGDLSCQGLFHYAWLHIAN